MWRATGIIHQRPDLARKYYKKFVGGDEDETKQEEVMEVIMTATLPVFPTTIVVCPPITTIDLWIGLLRPNR